MQTTLPPPNALTQTCTSARSRRGLTRSAALLAISALVVSFTASAKAPYHAATKPIKDDEGRVQVIIDFTDDAHVSYSGRNDDVQRGGKPLAGGDFVHKEKTLALVEDFERRHGLKRLGMTSWVGNSMTALVPPGQIDKLLAEPIVKQISDDEASRFSGYSPPWYNYNFNPEWMSWGGDAVNAKISTGNTGRKIYIIDSGVAYHQDLPPMVRKNVACGNGNCNAADPYNYPLVGCYPHSTHVAGIIGAIGGNNKTTRGVYAGFPNIVSLSVTKRTTSDNCGSSHSDQVTYRSYIGYALDYISWDNGANNPNKIIHVVNMSINPGGVEYVNMGAPAVNWGKVQGLASGIWMYGIQLVPGVLFVQSAGNFPSATFTDACKTAYRPDLYQAASPSDGVMVVGAANQWGRAVSSTEPFAASVPPVAGLAPDEYSAYGQCVDIWAPGDNIVSTWGAHSGATIDGVQYSGNVYDYATGGGWAFLSGTSMAAPHVAAVAAWLADVYSPATSGALETLVRQFSNQHGGAVDAAGFPVKVPRLP